MCRINKIATQTPKSHSAALSKMARNRIFVAKLAKDTTKFVLDMKFWVGNISYMANLNFVAFSKMARI